MARLIQAYVEDDDLEEIEVVPGYLADAIKGWLRSVRFESETNLAPEAARLRQAAIDAEREGLI